MHVRCIVEVKMTPNLPPLKTWQFYTACRRILGTTNLTKLYRRSPRQIYRWGADPDYTADHERHPLDRLKVMLSGLCDLGREDIALATGLWGAHTFIQASGWSVNFIGCILFIYVLQYPLHLQFNKKHNQLYFKSL